MKVPFTELSAHVPARYYLPRIAWAFVVGVVLGGAIVFSLTRSTTHSPAGAAVAKTVTMTPAAPIAAPSPTTPPATMRCSTGDYFDRLSTIRAGEYSDFEASVKLGEIRSRMRAYHVPEVGGGYARAADVCPSFVADVKNNISAVVVWAGPFPSRAQARKYCTRMGFSATQRGLWDCDPLSVSD